ncbi:MAG TPA: carotenoid biosynthesis protein [Aggregatilineales bacterium]|nr:carotenoid biosynthesis protein [Aggregatilineales bacterium]
MGCLWDAHRRGRFDVLELLWTAFYGFLLEWLTIKQLGAYHYGPFLIMIDGAPLAVALGWAVVIYCSMRFSSRIRLPEAARPILDALLALNVDLALDAVAIRLGMWAWTGVGLNQQWFGVPWVNFWAWFIVVWAFSGYLRALRHWQRHPVRRWLYAPCAVLLSLLTLLAVSESYRLMASSLGSDGFATLVLVAGSLAIIISLRPHILDGGPSQAIVVVAPLAIHLFATVVGFTYGFFGKQPLLGVVGLTMLAVGIILHVWPWWITRSRSISFQHMEDDSA